MNSLREKLDFGALIKKYSIASIIIGVLALAIGVLFIIAPLVLTSYAIWIGLGLIALGGLAAIIRFIFPGKGNSRDVFAFVFGLLVIAAFVILLVCALNTKQGSYVWRGETIVASGFEVFTAGLVGFFSIFFGVIAILYAVWSLCMIGSVEKGQKGWTIFSDILGLALGVLMIVFPFQYTFVAGIIVGVYVVIISIFTIAVAIKALVAAHKIKKAVKDKIVEPDKK